MSQSTTQPPLVCGYGVQTAAGFSTAANSAAFRGGLCAWTDIDWLPARRDGRPLRLARNPLLQSVDSVLERMLELAIGAVSECLAPILAAGYAAPGRIPPMPLLLSLPPHRPGWDDGHNAELVSRLVGALPVRIDPDQSGMLATGHHGALALLRDGLDLIADGRAAACLVGGIDSYMDMPVLDWMDMQRRLKAPDCPNGFVPGEGAAFLLLGSPAFREGLPRMPAVACLDACQQFDETPWYAGLPSLGAGLTRVVRALLEVGDRRADVTWCDHNGEPWRADEWGLAYLRTGERHGHPLDLRHPAATWGDLGAASGAALAALAAFELQRVGSRGPRTALVLTASDTNPFRSGCLLARSDSP